MAKSRHRKGFKEKQTKNRKSLEQDRVLLSHRVEVAKEKFMEQHRAELKKATDEVVATGSRAKMDELSDKMDSAKTFEKAAMAVDKLKGVPPVKLEDPVKIEGKNLTPTLKESMPSQHLDSFMKSKASEYADVDVVDMVAGREGWKGTHKVIEQYFELANGKFIGIGKRGDSVTFPVK